MNLIGLFSVMYLNQTKMRLQGQILFKEFCMKNRFKVSLVRLFGTQCHWLCAIAIIAVIGFSMTACGDDPPPENVVTTEDREATTAGRLTITGLNDYNGNVIRCYLYYIGGYDKHTITLYPVQTAYNCYFYTNGELDSVSMGGDSADTTITGNTVTTKVFCTSKTSDPFIYESYTGNDHVVFEARILDDGVNPTWGVDGKVEVNFSNGIGSGEFIPY
jgi:hypothetical protein